jgi:hypothetical protein
LFLSFAISPAASTGLDGSIASLLATGVMLTRDFWTADPLKEGGAGFLEVEPELDAAGDCLGVLSAFFWKKPKMELWAFWVDLDEGVGFDELLGVDISFPSRPRAILKESKDTGGIEEGEGERRVAGRGRHEMSAGYAWTHFDATRSHYASLATPARAPSLYIIYRHNFMLRAD